MSEVDDDPYSAMYDRDQIVAEIGRLRDVLTQVWDIVDGMLVDDDDTEWLDMRAALESVVGKGR